MRLPIRNPTSAVMPVETLIDPSVAAQVDVHDPNEVLVSVRRCVDDDRLDAEICVRFVDAAAAATLNSEFRGRHGPTNVLSFPGGFPELSPPVLGDIAICWDVVAAEAQQQGKSARNHATHMLVHGMLHLLGYDHVDAGEAERMEALEVEILQQLGIADPYWADA